MPSLACFALVGFEIIVRSFMDCNATSRDSTQSGATETSMIMAKSDPRQDIRLSSTLPPLLVIIPLSSDTIPGRSVPIAEIMIFLKSKVSS